MCCFCGRELVEDSEETLVAPDGLVAQGVDGEEQVDARAIDGDEGTSDFVDVLSAPHDTGRLSCELRQHVVSHRSLGHACTCMSLTWDMHVHTYNYVMGHVHSMGHACTTACI